MTDKSDLSFEESWVVAEKGFHVAVGAVLPLYTATIRAIRNAPSILQCSEEARIKKFCIEAAMMPVRVSPTMKTAYYWAAEEIYPEQLEAAAPIDLSKLLHLFSPGDLAAILALTYVYRSVKKRCDENEFMMLMPRLSMFLELGDLIGGHLPLVGSGCGMLAGGMRVLGLAAQAVRNPANMKKLRKRLEREGKIFSAEAEMELFGCTHMQIVSSMVSALGFGVAPRLAFGVQIPRFGGNFDAAVEECNDEILAWRLVIRCVESLFSSGTLPKDLSEREVGLFSTKKLKELERNATGIVSRGDGFRWVRRPSDELNDRIKELLDIRAQESLRDGSPRSPANEAVTEPTDTVATE